MIFSLIFGTVTIIFFRSYDYLPQNFDGHFLGNETKYVIKNKHIQQDRTDEPGSLVILDNNTLQWRN